MSISIAWRRSSFRSLHPVFYTTVLPANPTFPIDSFQLSPSYDVHHFGRPRTPAFAVRLSFWRPLSLPSRSSFSFSLSSYLVLSFNSSLFLFSSPLFPPLFLLQFLCVDWNHPTFLFLSVSAWIPLLAFNPSSFLSLHRATFIILFFCFPSSFFFSLSLSSTIIGCLFNWPLFHHSSLSSFFLFFLLLFLLPIFILLTNLFSPALFLSSLFLHLSALTLAQLIQPKPPFLSRAFLFGRPFLLPPLFLVCNLGKLISSFSFLFSAPGSIKYF